MLRPALPLVLALAALVPAATARESGRLGPNVLLLFVDDLGWGDLGCQGSAFHETPAIDALAADGVRFTQAYANAPNCAPSRACLWSGQLAPRHGVYTVGSAKRGRAPFRRLVPVENRTVLDDAFVTLAEVLRDAGWATAHLGKWHLGEDPRTQGFDLNVAGTTFGHPSSYFSPYANPFLEDGPEGEHLTARLTDEACAFLEEHADRPFLLSMSYYAVHTPIQAVPDLAGRFEGRPGGGARQPAAYGSMVAAVDRSVGRLLAKLDELGLEGETLVLFTSDNGGHGSFTAPSILRGAKGMLYEGGLRVPLLARWPGRIAPGRTCPDLAIGCDLFPTILELCDVAAPEGLLLDGASLAPRLLRDEPGDERALIWHFPAYLEASAGAGTWRTTPAGAIRRGRHKLLEWFEDGHVELYDLADDPGEERDLALEEPELASALLAELRAWREATGAFVPTEPEPAYRPGEADADQ